MDITKVINVLTNGVGEKPYYRRNRISAEETEVVVYVADDCEICTIFMDEPDFYPEEMAEAICEAGLMLRQLQAELEIANEEVLLSDKLCPIGQTESCGYWVKQQKQIEQLQAKNKEAEDRTIMLNEHIVELQADLEKVKKWIKVWRKEIETVWNMGKGNSGTAATTQHLGELEKVLT